VIPLAAAGVAYIATDELGGSGFIACFVAGLVFGRLVGPARERVIDLTEEVGGVLSAVTFFMFAAVLAGPALNNLDAATVIYAVLSLTVVRMLPVAIAYIGSGSARQTRLFAGWFGPRGLASIVFALTVVEESGLEGTKRIVQVATVTVLLSVFAHGITAPALTDRYVAWFNARRDRLTLESSEVPVARNPRGGLWSDR
jgi:NhaP-type Na+/H+ or K+/H+ antiporter